MATFTVRQGKRYRATIALGMLERFASNDIIASRLQEAGFTEVSVSGNGATRHAEARGNLMRAQRCRRRSPPLPNCEKLRDRIWVRASRHRRYPRARQLAPISISVSYTRRAKSVRSSSQIREETTMSDVYVFPGSRQTTSSPSRMMLSAQSAPSGSSFAQCLGNISQNLCSIHRMRRRRWLSGTSSVSSRRTGERAPMSWHISRNLNRRSVLEALPSIGLRMISKRLDRQEPNSCRRVPKTVQPENCHDLAR